MPTQMDLRQSRYLGLLDQLSANVTNQTAEHLIAAANNQLTPLLRMSAAASPSLVVSVGAGDLTDSETNRRRAIPHVGTAYVQFTSGTATFPSSSGGNIVCSPGNNIVLTVASGNFAAVLVYLDGSGNLNALPGADSAVLNTAITNLPPSPDDTLPLGFVIVQNIAGTIQNIVQSRIAQFGTGTGGGGSGNVTALETALRDYNNFAGTKYLDPNIFRTSKSTKVDGSSTGSFDLVKNAFKFTSIGQTFVSTNLANAEFLAEGVDIPDLHLYVNWLLGFIDTAATYEASRDGGTNWSTVSMTRVGSASNAYRGYLTFSDETVQQSLQTVTATGAGTALNATTNQALSSQLVLSTTSVVRQVQLQMNRATTGSTGNFKVQIVNNSGGVPSTALADLRAESNFVSISGLSTGNITVTVDLPDTPLVAGTYHVVVSTDAAYKAGTLDLSWRNGAGTNGATYNGTSWTGGASTKAATVQGRALDLRIRITAGTGLTYLEGMGVFFPSDDGIVQPNGTKNVQRFYFTGDSNTTGFALNWVPDPDLLDIIDPYRGQIYAIEPNVAKIAGQTVTFAPNTFNFPGESIVLIFRQVKGIAIDNSDSNAAAISTHTQNLLDVGDETSDLEYVTIPKISVANTTITNRAQIPDMSQDLASRFSFGRVYTQDIYLVEGEFGPGGELIWKTLNDRYDRTRFVGAWSQSSGSFGNSIVPTNTSDYMEITFYGTGIDMLMANSSASFDFKYAIDGGSEVSFFTNTPSAIIGGRNTNPYTVFPVVSGLSLATHTIKIRPNTNPASIGISGFEVLNDTFQLNPGSQFVRGSKRTLASQQALTYNSGFETGTLGTVGGRVLVYQKLDSTIAKAVQPTDSTTLTLGSASHANEEVARIFYAREFGAARNATGVADDFSLEGATARSRAFTLDNGTTTLSGNNSFVSTVQNKESVTTSNSTANSLLFTFTGTGLDIETDATLTTWQFSAVSIDNAASLGALASGVVGQTTKKIVSGLPYGTHTVRFTGDNTATLGITKFIVYQPKTPTLPAYAKALSAYNILGNFSANATAGQSTIASGVIRKHATRENIYVGTWTATLTITDIGGWQLSSTTTGDFVQYTFFGTGFDYRFTNNATSATWQFTVDGSTNLTTLSGTPVTSSYGAGITSFTASTGTLVTSTTATTGNGIRLSGLTLGIHTVKFAKTAGTGTVFTTAWDIITPIHSPKSDTYDVEQNTLTVGSQGIEDLRKISSLEQITYQKSWAQAIGITSNPTTGNASFLPIPDMSVTIKTTSGALDLNFVGEFSSTGASGSAYTIQFYVDGVAVGNGMHDESTNTSVPAVTANHWIMNVSPGVHKVDMYWQFNAGNATQANGTKRVLTVKELF